MKSLIKRFGMFDNKPVKCIDKDNLFVLSGVNIIASLAGEGKTTEIIARSKGWVSDGYDVLHINFDNAPTYGSDMLNCPVSDEDYNDFWKILKDEATNKTILVIDSLKAMCSYLGLEIESNTDMYPLLMKLRILCKETGLTLVLVHHTYKPKNVKTMPSSFYGSRAIEEQSDSAFILENGNYRIVKNRAGHIRDTIVEGTI